VWKRLEHPNVVPLLGVTTAPLQLVSVWMPGGELLEYIERNPSADRLSLVGFHRTTLDGGLNLLRYLMLRTVLATSTPTVSSTVILKGFVKLTGILQTY